MKKRFVSLALALVMCLGLLAAPASAATGSAPYSTRYLSDAIILHYVNLMSLDPSDLGYGSGYSQATGEVYRFNSMLGYDYAILTIRRSFSGAGFKVAESTDENGEEVYTFTKDGDIFFTIGEKACKELLDEENQLCLYHVYASGESDPQPSETPAPTPSGNPSSDAEGLSNFTKSNSYTAGQFTDVTSGAWYASYVQAAYEYGLMQGVNANTFNVNGKLTVAETIAIAARLHATYYDKKDAFSAGTPWYQPYVDYAIENGICSAYPDYNVAISRASFAMILTNALPAEALQAKNTVEEDGIPDVPSNANYHDAVYRLYRAGVLSGTDSYGTFAPFNQITRAEVSVILSSMVDTSLRKSFTLKTIVKPTALKLSATSFVVNIGAKQALKATVTPMNTTLPVTWSSSNPGVATVAADGTVTGVAAGTATITAKCGTLTATSKVTVEKPLPIGRPTGFYFTRNSVDGITLSFDGKNNSGKTINYYTVYVTFLDPIGNPAIDEITHRSTASVRYVGPVAPGRSIVVYKLLGYVPACDAIRIDTIKLEYADGTTETIRYNQTTTREEHF